MASPHEIRSLKKKPVTFSEDSSRKKATGSKAQTHTKDTDITTQPSLPTEKTPTGNGQQSKPSLEGETLSVEEKVAEKTETEPQSLTQPKPPSQTGIRENKETPPTTTDTEAETDTDKPHFQAIGTLYGTVEKNDDDIFFIQLGKKSYRLFFVGYRYAAFLKQYENNPKTPLYFRVYPKYRIIPRQPPEVYFQPIAWDTEKQWGEPGIFTLKGVWQFIPQNRTPMISVYRNGQASDPTGKFKAAHIPVLMRREDEANPFRFNPKIEKEELPPRWFIQANFRFMSSRDCWGWVEDIEAPTKEIPWYKKPKKEVTGGKSGKGVEKPLRILG